MRRKLNFTHFKEDVISSLERYLDSRTQIDDRAIVAFVAARDIALVQSIVDTCSNKGVSLFGGVFPALVVNGEVCDHGVLLAEVPMAGEGLVTSIEGPVDDQELAAWKASVPAQANTLLVLADYACVQITELLNGLQDLFANEVNYFGGGCGAGTRVPSGVVFSHNGIASGSAVVVPIASESSVALRHGWEVLSEQMVASDTDGNIIRTINWQPAMDAYRHVVGEQVSDSLANGADVPEAKRFPFGIRRAGEEPVIRDPLHATEDGSLMVLSGVPSHATMSVMKGDDARLTEAAYELGADVARLEPAGHLLVFDCFSRAMLYGASKRDADLIAMKRAFRDSDVEVSLYGAMASGEICSDGLRYVDFHNKTVAICSFGA